MSTLLDSNLKSDSEDEDYVFDAKASDSESDEDFVPIEEGREDASSVVTGGKRKSARLNSNERDMKKLRSETGVANQTQRSEEEMKKRMDTMWAQINNNEANNELQQDDSVQTDKESEKQDSDLLKDNPEKVAKRGSSKLITITRTYEFAGDFITEETEVPEDSDEAKAYLLAQSQTSSSEQLNDNSHASLQSSESSRSKPILPVKQRPAKSQRAKSNLSKLVDAMKKPTKLNTLDKSKLDWNKFVDKEGIKDELKYHNKNGFIEKQDFLQRTYSRQEADLKAMRKKTRKDSQE
ncbi:8014_t:CDS:2 [Paraglomus occultum]|uniref:SWR1-complex protein 5 n=1 Tax=Paraglomus occultum TaxID=144539 RepID=A0A9N8Z6N5_9GLOM|nr:8014_t:CDS:2 [Paraglomus occultum]